jgi:hypothetical protein
MHRVIHNLISVHVRFCRRAVMGSGAESAGRLLEEAAEGAALVDRASKVLPVWIP